MLQADYFWLMEAIAQRKVELIKQGMSPQEAERQATREYDGPEAATEYD